ncbi:MAG: lipopolysaccharide biosynthesis protein [Phycisphaerales bacterium]|nr:lipopolysaccharide biosynthesis protein [Phycisphaerales bacterium]
MSAEADQDQYFRTEGLKPDLRGRSVRGGAITLIAQGGRFAIELSATAVLARLLLPEDFGLIAMVLAITGFVARFKDLGLAMSTVQRAEINHQQVSTLFWVNVVFGVAIMLFTAAMAPLVAWFYKEPRLIWVTVGLATGFLFGGLTVQHQALLRRQMRFADLARIQVAAAALASAAGIFSAWLGAGYWALVIMQLVAAATIAIGVWIMCGWRPGAPTRASGVGSMLAFGGNLTAAAILNYVVRNLDNVLVGWRWGAGALGFYSKAYQLVLLPVRKFNSPVSTVAIPTLSHLQNKADLYRGYYRRGIMLVATVSMPIVAFAFAAADDIVMVVLGPKWIEAIRIFRVLAPAAMVTAINVATTWVFVSLGQPQRMLRWNVIEAVVTTLAFIIGLRWGAIGVAAGCSVALSALWLPSIVYCFKTSPLKIADLLGMIWRPALSSTVAAVVILALGAFVLPSVPSLISLTLNLAIYCCAYVLLWMIVPNGRRMIWETLQLVRELRTTAGGETELDVTEKK